MSKVVVSAADVELVFKVWQSYRPKPKLCLFTEDRKKLIRDRLKLGYTPEHLTGLFRYVFESNDSWCRFMRGENDRRKAYTGLDSLLRKAKLADRIEKALLWSEIHDDSFIMPTDDQFQPGALSAFRGGPAGEA